MALHQDDIIKLDLNRTGFHRSFLNHTIGKNDTKANRMGVELYRGNVPVNLSHATCEGFFLSPAGQHIVISGDYAGTDGNVAYVDLPAACYNYEGQFTLAIKVIGGGVTGTIRMIDGQVVNTFTDGAVAPVESVPSYQEVLAVYDQMVEALDTVAQLEDDVEALGGRVDTCEDDITTLGGRVDTCEDDITALGGRVDTCEDDIDACERRLDTCEDDIDACEGTLALSIARDDAFRNAESVPYTLQNKKFIDYRDGSLADFNDETFYATDFIPVVGGKKIVVADYRPAIQTADLAGFAFYNASKTFISGVQYTAPNEPILMTIPATAAYMRATWFSNTGKNLKIVMQNYTAAEIDVFNKRDDAFRNAESVPYTLQNKKFIDYRDGSLANFDDTNFNATDFIKVIGGKKIVVADYRPAVQTADLAGFAFYNAGGTFISGVQYQAPNEPIEMTIPAAAAYMRATWFGNTGRNLKIVMQNYTAAEISLRGGIVINSTPSAPYDDADTIPVGTVVTYITSMPSHIPSGLDGIVTIITTNYHTVTLGGSVQILFDKNSSWFRVATTESAYQPWVGNNIHTESAFSLFQTVGVIGDSYASGALTLESYSGNDHYPISWPQIVARKNGITVTNFSKGGLTTKTWLSDDHGLSLLNSESAKDLYICVLGINDNASGGSSYLGVEADIGTDNDTFYGNYAKIISAIQTKAPNAKIVLSTMAPTAPGSYVAEYNEAIVKIAAHFQIPCMIQGEDPFFNSPQYYNNIRYNHPMAGGYVHMANAFDRMLCRVMDSNVNYFANYGVNK